MKEQLVKLLGLEGGNSRGEGVKEIPLVAVRPNPFQPRKEFAEEELEELANSIRQYGVLQPIVVRPGREGFELVAGERRLRACRLVGLSTIPAVIKELTDHDVAVLALVENLQREDLNFLEEAMGYQRLLEEFGFTQEELAGRLGKSQSTVANKIRLLRLSPRVRTLISREMLTERHARALLKLKEEETQLEVVKKIVQQGLTVKETEEYIARLLSGESNEEKKRQNVVRIYKDMRIFLNTIRRAAKELQAVGFPARVKEEEREDHYEVTILIPKEREKDEKPHP